MPNPSYLPYSCYVWLEHKGPKVARLFGSQARGSQARGSQRWKYQTDDAAGGGWRHWVLMDAVNIRRVGVGEKRGGGEISIFINFV